MANLPKPQDRAPNPKAGKDVWLAVIFALFVVLALAAMMAIDAIGEAKMGDMDSSTKLHDAAANQAG